jgi:hypothetical protein
VAAAKRAQFAEERRKRAEEAAAEQLVERGKEMEANVRAAAALREAAAIAATQEAGSRGPREPPTEAEMAVLLHRCRSEGGEDVVQRLREAVEMVRSGVKVVDARTAQAVEAYSVISERLEATGDLRLALQTAGAGLLAINSRRFNSFALAALQQLRLRLGTDATSMSVEECRKYFADRQSAIRARLGEAAPAPTLASTIMQQLTTAATAAAAAAPSAPISSPAVPSVPPAVTTTAPPAAAAIQETARSIIAAAWTGRPEALLRLVSEASKPGSRAATLSLSVLKTAHPDNGVTCLMVAAGKGDEALVQDLIKLGVDLGTCDLAGNNALAWACSYQRAECARALVAASSTLTAQQLAALPAHAKRVFDAALLRARVPATASTGGPQRRRLQAWRPESAEGAGEAALDGGSGAGGWDQFAANERLFNVKAKFDESQYTSQMATRDELGASFEEKARRADAIAREAAAEAAATSAAGGAQRFVRDREMGEDADEAEAFTDVARTPSAGSAVSDSFTDAGVAAASSRRRAT